MKAAIFFSFFLVASMALSQPDSNRVSLDTSRFADPNALAPEYTDTVEQKTYGAHGWDARPSPNSHIERRIVSGPDFDELADEQGRVAVDLVVDEEGQVVRVQYNPGKSNTGSQVLIQHALRAARTLRFEARPGSGAERMTYFFEFELR